MTAPGNNKVQTGADQNDWVVLGEISGVYGVKGWVKVFSYTEPREGIIQYKEWYLQTKQGWQPVKVLNGRKQGKGVVAQLENCNDRDAAMLLRGTPVAVPRSALQPLPAGEYYWSDLIGLQVINKEGVDLGKVEDMLETGANDVMIVRGERERLIPFTQGNAVLKVDLAAGQVQVDWDPEF